MLCSFKKGFALDFRLLHTTKKNRHLFEKCGLLKTSSEGKFLFRGSYRGFLVMRDWLILFSVKCEFRKLFFVTRDLKVLRDPWRTWNRNRYSRYSWFYHSILRDFQTQILRMVRTVRNLYRECLRYAICIMEPWLHFLQALLLVYEQLILVRHSVTRLFLWFTETNFLYRWTVILYFLFVNRRQ